MGKSAALAWDSGADSDQAGSVIAKDEPSRGRVRTTGAKKTKRIQYTRRTVEFHPELERLLETLQENLHLRSQTEVIQKAIQLLALAVGTDKTKSKKIYIEKDDGKLQEVLIL